MKSLKQYIIESLSNRYTPVENHVRFLRNMVPEPPAVIRAVEDTGIEVLSSRFGSKGHRDAWLYADVSGGSPVYRKRVVDWAAEMKFQIWIRKVSASDYRIILWPGDVSKYPWKDESEQLM